MAPQSPRPARRPPEPEPDDLDDDGDGDEGLSEDEILDGAARPTALPGPDEQTEIDDVDYEPEDGAQLEVFTSAFSRSAKPIAVRIEFLDTDTEELVEAKTFGFVHDANAGALMAVASMVIVTQDGKQQINMNALSHFFRLVVMTDQYDRFIWACNRQSPVVRFRTLMDIYYRLMEVYTDQRPLVQSGPSSRSARRAGARSTAKGRSTAQLTSGR